MAKIKAKKLKKRIEHRIKFDQNNITQSEETKAFECGMRVTLYYIDEMVAEKKAKRSTKNASHKVTEVCTFCENAVTLYWDTKHDGYEIYCPCCGKRMTLKDAYYREVTAKEQEDADNKKFQPKEGEDCVY